MITRSLLIIFCLFLGDVVAFGQASDKKVVSMKEVTENPWPFAPKFEAFQEKYSEYLKTGKYTLKNRIDPSHKDTIIKMTKGKTELFFFKPYNGNASFIAANLYDKRFKLKGGIGVGISTTEFYGRIAFPDNNKDSVQLTLPEGAYRTLIVLKNGKVDHIKIEAQNKNK
jgi:hypothetical protein